MKLKQIAVVAMFWGCMTLPFSVALSQITIPTVSVGNAGNAADPFTGSLYGSVAYSYNIGMTEVTNAQYAAFLNAKAASDPFNLYNTNMAGSFGGITRSGSPGSFTYSIVSGRANNPVNFVSFWDATRFANWLHNGQGSGDTENGAYTLTPAGISSNAITRNPGWRWAVTSENEWYKAAYHQPASAGGDADNYWLYATSSNGVPSTVQANFNSLIGNTTSVASYASNYYGVFDMVGNVWEWNEAIVFGSDRGLRGGGFASLVNTLQSSFRYNNAPTNENSNEGDFGFRVSQFSAPSCVGDLNGDNAVNTTDLTVLLARFGTVVPPGSPEDFNSDGAVNTADLTTFLGRFGSAC